jgi:Rrf2 family protein
MKYSNTEMTERNKAMAGLVRVSEAASLGLHAAMLLACATSPWVRTRDLGERIGASQAHLVKVLQSLARAGLVETERGPHGGARLARPAGEITLLRVYEAIDGPLETTECLLARPICDGTCCMVGKMLYRMNQDVREHLARTSLAEVWSACGPAVAGSESKG